jgi:hypothetical protein
MATTFTEQTQPLIDTGRDLDVADRVSAHMETTFPYIETSGGWICLRDERDGSAAIAYKNGSSLLDTVGIRGNMLWRWMCSLRDVGFTVEPRLDMELYGDPDAESPDGRARWLHVSAWATPVERKPRMQLFPYDSHVVVLDPDANPPMDGVMHKGVRPNLAVFTYLPDGRYGGMTVSVYANEVGQPVATNAVPSWLWDIGMAHRGHKKSWCYLEVRGTA